MARTSPTTGFDSNVQLVGTDASGGDVFFSSADVLSSQDSSSNRQLYDARVDGGFPHACGAGVLG
jgi:hypothetical protein